MAHRQRHQRVLALERCGSSMLRGVLTALVAIALALPAAVAAEGMLDLPPRPEPPTPYLPPTPAPSPAPRHSAGAHIRLLVAPEVVGDAAPSVMWTVVQWEDEAGGWYDVEWWCGHLDDTRGRQRLVGQPADYGRGTVPLGHPPRPGAVAELATSAPFDLPSQERQVLDVAVALP